MVIISKHDQLLLSNMETQMHSIVCYLTTTGNQGLSCTRLALNCDLHPLGELVAIAVVWQANLLSHYLHLQEANC